MATIIRPAIQDKYGQHVAVSAPQIGKILVEFELTDMPYFQEDTKVSRKYITRQGIDALLMAMDQEPLRFLKSFSSKQNIASYEDSL